MPGSQFRNFSNRHSLLSLLLLAVFAIVLAGTVFLLDRGGLGDIRSRAWSGASVQLTALGLLRQKSQGDINPIDNAKEEENSQRRLFHSLTRTYPNAEVQNIDEPSAGVKGVAFLKYDAQLGKTFVYSRLANMPVPQTGFVQLWISKNVNEYQKAGIAQWHNEAGIAVLYSVFVRDGDLRGWETLLVSYDTDTKGARPELVVLSLAL